jgi:sortase A
MKPDETNSSQSGKPLLPQRQFVSVPPRSLSASQAAAAQVVRGQIDSIYNNQETPSSSDAVVATPLQLSNAINPDINPYERTHIEHVDPQAEQWQKYHSAWQTYYQKYYEGYYSHHLHKAQEALVAHTVTTATQSGNTYFSGEPDQTEESSDEFLSKDEALFDLRQKLLSKVRSSAIKVRKSRHFVPLAAGLIVVLIFAFLQYNQLLIANVMAYVSPGAIDPQNIVVDPSSNVSVGPQPLLIIPKINVDVPVAYGIGNDYTSQMAAMANGLAWFGVPGASSVPGEVGNTVLAGHSSNDLLDKGDYKFIFAQLDKLVPGDTVYANYHSIRYTYVVTGLKVVSPTDVSSLIYPTTKPILTLLTCTPVGTSQNRLLVIAEQVSPDPTTSTPAPASTTKNSKPASIPGTEPTILEKLFGAK